MWTESTRQIKGVLSSDQNNNTEVFSPNLKVLLFPYLFFICYRATRICLLGRCLLDFSVQWYICHLWSVPSWPSDCMGTVSSVDGGMLSSQCSNMKAYPQGRTCDSEDRWRNVHRIKCSQLFLYQLVLMHLLVLQFLAPTIQWISWNLNWTDPTSSVGITLWNWNLLHYNK